MKKKIIWTVVVAIVVILAGVVIYYFASTKSVNQCLAFCKEESSRGATEFSGMTDEEYAHKYMYLISIDGNKDAPQEIFVFRLTTLGPFSFDRYRLVTGIIGDSENVSDSRIGSLLYYRKDDSGEQESTETLVFFGSDESSKPVKFTYTLTTTDGTSELEHRVLRTDGVWFARIYDITNAYAHKKLISNVKFYDEDGNLVGTYK